MTSSVWPEELVFSSSRTRPSPPVMEMLTVAPLMGKLFKEEFTAMESFPLSVVLFCDALKIKDDLPVLFLYNIWKKCASGAGHKIHKISWDKRVEMWKALW